MGKKEYVKMSGKGPLAPPPAAASSGKPMKGKKQETTRSKGKEKDVGGGANPEQRNGKSKQKVEHQATKSLSKPGKGNLKRKGGETGGRRRGVDDSDEDGDSEDAESHIYVSKSGGKLGPSTGDDFDGEDPSSPFSNCPHLPELSLSLSCSLSLLLQTRRLMRMRRSIPVTRIAMGTSMGSCGGLLGNLARERRHHPRERKPSTLMRMRTRTRTRRMKMMRTKMGMTRTG